VIPHGEWEEELGNILPIVDPLYISKLAEAKHLKNCVHIKGWGLLPKKLQG